MENPFQKRVPGKFSSKNRAVKNFTVKLNKHRTTWEKVADFLTSIFGSLPFVILHFIWFSIWLVWNNGLFGLIPFDPYPFGLLTTLVSLEAIFLAIFVLVSQNRSSKVDQMRSEVDLQVDLATEEEIIKILYILKILAEKNGIDLSDDNQLKKMLEPINEWEVEKQLEKQLVSKSNK